MASNSVNHKSILVSGGNKGIGYAICKRLIQIPNTQVFLGSRSLERGEAAAAELRSHAASGSNLSVVVLDVDDVNSINRAVDMVRSQCKTLDVLINNAGIYDPGERSKVVAETMYKTNVYGTWEVSRCFLSLLPKGGRIINVSSLAATLSFRQMNPEIRDKFLSDDITFANMCSLLDDYANAVEDGTYLEKGWPKFKWDMYGISKCGVTSITRILARENPQLIVNCCCPGSVKTDMNPTGILTPFMAAQTPTHLAIGDLKGKTGPLFWQDMQTTPFY
eukprot:186130_1